MKLDFLIPASPTDGFFSQIAFFKLCLNALGSHYESARLVAVFGDHQTETIPQEWRAYFDAIEVEWAHLPGAVNEDHRAQHDRRFEVIRSHADIAILCDADIAVLRPFDSLLDQLIDKPALAGVIAHYHFPWPPRVRDPDRQWSALANAVIGKDVARPHRYTLMKPERAQATPFYINYGMLAAPPALFEEFYPRDLQLRPKIAQFLGHWWAPQVSVPLTCADLDLPTRALPMRYNFPNDPIADRLHSEELERIVFLHYLRTNRFDRAKVFASESHFNAFLTADLKHSNECFREHVLVLTGGRFPFSR